MSMQMEEEGLAEHLMVCLKKGNSISTLKCCQAIIIQTYIMFINRIFTRRLSALLPGMASLSFSFSKLATAKHTLKTPETLSFKTQTQRLLEIVAKSLYTDKEVFLRQLLSNASDAIEKRRFLALKEGKDVNQQFQIFVTTDQTKRQLIIQDNGIGMSRQQMVDNLGTIARSGSKQFVENVIKKSNVSENESIIGQFGVGFYSSFIVGTYIQVVSRRQQSEQAFCWTSDGSGQFSIAEVEDCDIKQGTKIVINLRPDCQMFCQKDNLLKIIEKYSNFITYPIFLNGDKLTMVKALWTRDKRQIPEEDYVSFFKTLSAHNQFKYKLHYNTDVPISIKSVFFIPKRDEQVLGTNQEHSVHLYSRKIAIKRNCKELLPHFLRFVYGVVDCEDLPLNISRQNYQDSALITRLKDVLTRRIVKLLLDEAQKSPEEYQVWYDTFQKYIKEGMIQHNYRMDVAQLLRYTISGQSKKMSLSQYVKSMKAGQTSIYYLSGVDVKNITKNSYLEPYIASQIPVLVSGSPYQDIIFNQLGNYKGHRFVNIQTNQEDMSKLFNPQQQSAQSIPEEEFKTFALWIKDHLAPTVTKVVVCSKPIAGPAFVTSAFSSAMRNLKYLASAMQKSGQPMQQFTKNMTMQINTKNELMVKLNDLRKRDNERAVSILHLILDATMTRAGMPVDTEKSTNRMNDFIKQVFQLTK